MTTTYDHTQYGYFHWLLYLFSLACLVAAGYAILLGVLPFVIVAAVGVLMGTLAASFHYLRVVDAGDRLMFQFGPLPILHGSVEYKSIVAVEADRSLLIDGWGIHWLPGRGWTYNIWGFDCVLVTLDTGSTLRIGSDDADNLLEFLKARMRRADIEIG
jgi:hypothetical protein